jgi:hypothetical protein
MQKYGAYSGHFALRYVKSTKYGAGRLRQINKPPAGCAIVAQQWE